MKNIIPVLLAFLLAGGAVSGGAEATAPQGAAHSSPQGGNAAFRVVSDAEAVQGEAVAEIMLEVKSNYSYRLGSYRKHENPPYRAHLSIDGQTMVLNAEPTLEDKKPSAPRSPESGTGWKYHFTRNIALAPGKRQLTVFLPIDAVTLTREIELRPGFNKVHLTPVYKTRMLRPYRGQHFSAGVKSVDIAVAHSP